MQNKGFTLIEILVVLLIIGITLSFALIAFGDFGAERRIHISAEQFVNYLTFAQKEAVLESGSLGISVYTNSYQLFRFEPSGRWQIPSNHHVFKPQAFPEHTLLRLDSALKEPPQIRINDQGEFTPFSLTLSSSPDHPLLRIIGTTHQRLYIQKVGTL